MPYVATNSVTIEFDALKRLMAAARLSGCRSPEAAELAAAADLAPWRTPIRRPKHVAFTAEAAQHISDAALRGLTAVQEGDEAWRSQVVSDLCDVADACRLTAAGRPPVRDHDG